MFNILIVDDEKKITQVIKAYLEKEGYNCIVANNGEQALKYITNNNLDLIILDRMLPDISGENICKKVRETSMVHIIMLTAKTEDEDRIEGFNTGCDDYVCKPFNVKELVLRVKAVFRKLDVENKDVLKFSDKLEINMSSHDVKVRGEKIILTNTEYKILLLFAKNPNRIFSREQLLELAIEEHYEKVDRIIDAHIKNLRQKIELDTKKAKIIQTVYGVGYKFGL
ncbi:response regulator transcription factor [Paraclostridium bifermentans]|uniref:Stage 0 sporulation protein A homolog n=1 Tax=Paraclostridium bifermentans ATCC 638 = DSM 14991 TaxID=1233171 RepID=T4VTK9_PARBF|nr:response regulator transcription factor [Paraclostridium bifermentans]EQK44037.1 transcriptional regulatory family protein [[Clostridium] bifermentans ATCC 638] [Paraclostridium bifermentans ATCC 638 = DSM 14991]MBS5953863.1 response regulator transcription factor [Paraclostridium bifermentans]MBU5289305.1 response regulator transcription factor [Paraclostridium bifermentans]RIZ58558.1 DNA-binding response regulator [Paraclostridium bifermentans]UAG19777.1 response regulator transcription f